MWCPQCRADVVAALSVDNRRLECAKCGQEIGHAAGATPIPHRPLASAKTAQELLARWSTDDTLEPVLKPLVPFELPPRSPTIATPALEKPVATPIETPTIDAPGTITEPAMKAASETISDSNNSSGSPAIGAPLAHGEVPMDITDTNAIAGQASPATAADPATNTGIPAAVELAQPPAEEPSRAAETNAPIPKPRFATRAAAAAHTPAATARTRRIDTGNAAPITKPESLPTPHIKEARRRKLPAQPIATAPAPEAVRTTSTAGSDSQIDRASSYSVVAGQLCAYAGVATLTVGTALVLWAWFGGPMHYAPTGWLLTTLGQMLLFLGVVALVSGGLEQTTREVGRRIERLGDRLIRLETFHSAAPLRGPHFSHRRLRRKVAGVARSQPRTPARD